MKRLASLSLLLALLVVSTAVPQGKDAPDKVPQVVPPVVNPPIPEKPDESKYHRGLKFDPVKVRMMHARASKANGHRMKDLPAATPETFDCQAVFGCVLPMNNQGSCGDCYMVSLLDDVSMILCKGGYGKADGSFRLSSQFGLDCKGQLGGCNGGFPAEVADYVKANGWPLESDYGAYTARPARCKSTTGMKLWTIADWGYCTSSQQEGMATAQEMKNAMVRYGPISVCFDAGGCDNYRAGQVMRGGGRNINHAVLCVGWKTENGKTVFKGMNQWGTGWGDQGYFWIEENAWGWGTDALWVSANVLPPPPPDPDPPTPPTPPVPPGNFVPPFFIMATGFLKEADTLAQAMPIAQTQANSCQCTVQVLDSKTTVAATVTPTLPPVPPANTIIVDKAGTYQLLTDDDVKELRESGKTLSEALATHRAIRLLTVPSPKQSVEPPCCNPK